MSNDEKAQKYVQEVVRILQRTRLAKGLSLNQLAWMSGISQTALSYIESGKRNPTLRTLKSIADQLETPLSQILSEVEKPPR